MNWKLIAQLSLFGLAMGLGTVFFIPSSVEPFCWLVIFITCAYLIAKHAGNRPFLHGLVLGLANCVWITGSHLVFVNRYLESHAKEAEMMASMPMPDHPRLMMALVGTLVGIISGVVIGILSICAVKVMKGSR
ncbi:MAG TPA: hypothetical protein VGL53_26930 [Bryobacteraceae bacterium]|jgi:hypothetical protein